MPRPVHGGTNIAELRSLGLRPEDVLDFSASINPMGAPSGAARAMTEVDLAAYPDTECTALREALAAASGRLDSTDSGWQRLHRAYSSDGARLPENPATRLQSSRPHFGEFAAACEMQGAQAVSIGGA